MKPEFTEKQIEDMCDMYYYNGYQRAVYKIDKFLKDKFKLSNVHSIVTDIRIEFRNKRCHDLVTKHAIKYKDSGLLDKLMERLDYVDYVGKK